MKIQLQLHYTTLSSSHRTIKPAEQNHKYKEGKKTSIKKKSYVSRQQIGDA